MADGDGVRDNSQTGNFPRIELEPRLDPERQKRTIKPAKPNNEMASTTGIMRVFSEPADESAVGDEDKPIE